MTYREQLNKVNAFGIDIFDLSIADELDTILSFDYTDEEFERLCEYARNAYYEAYEMTITAIANCINDLVNEDGKTVEEVLEMDKRDFVDKASNWL